MLLALVLVALVQEAPVFIALVCFAQKLAPTCLHGLHIFATQAWANIVNTVNAKCHLVVETNCWKLFIAAV